MYCRINLIDMKKLYKFKTSNTHILQNEDLRCMSYLVVLYQYKMNAEECNKVVKDEIIKSRSSSISIKFIS